MNDYESRPLSPDHLMPGQEGAGGQERQPYETPELIEWGMVHDLTKGLQNPPEDFPDLGGSQPT